MLLSFVFLTVALETSYLMRMYWNDLHKIFTIGTHMGGYDLVRPFFRDCSRGVAMVTYFWGESAKIGIPNFILHVRWHSTTDGRIVTWMRLYAR